MKISKIEMREECNRINKDTQGVTGADAQREALKNLKKRKSLYLQAFS